MATTTTRTMFHEGELAVQRRAGVEAVASQGRPLHPRLDPTRPRRLPLPATVRRPRCHGRRRTRLGLFRRRWHRLRICPRRPPPPPGRDPRPGRGAADRLRSPMPGGDPRDRVLHPHANPIERARQSRSGRDRARRRGGFRQLPEVHPTTRPSRRARGRAGGRHPKRNLPRHRPGESGRSRRHVLHRERPRTPGRGRIASGRPTRFRPGCARRSPQHPLPLQRLRALLRRRGRPNPAPCRRLVLPMPSPSRHGCAVYDSFDPQQLAVHIDGERLLPTAHQDVVPTGTDRSLLGSE